MDSKLNFIWCAYGSNAKKVTEFLKLIKRSIQSVKKHNKNASCYIMVDHNFFPKSPLYNLRNLKIGDSQVDILPNFTKGSPFLGKMKSLVAAPRGKNIYLDSDVICLQNVEGLSLMLDKYDFLGTPNHNPKKRTSSSAGFRGKKLAKSNIPTHFTSVQGGVFAWNSESERVYNIFKKHIYKHGKWGRRDDQVSLTKMIWEEDELRFYMLSPSYNFIDPIMGRYFKSRGKAPFYHYSGIRSGSFNGRSDLNIVRRALHNKMLNDFILPQPKQKHQYDKF